MTFFRKVLLSFITLGVYSAWAKVRRKKYFYNNTLIDNIGFDYHAKPISILKGRVIAFLFFFGYSASASISPFLPILFMLILFIALPWLIVRGSLFNARNTSHRGLRFDFVGTVSQAVKVFIGLPMLLLPTMGLIMPYAAHQKSQFMVNNHKFGLSQFNMQPVIKKYFKVYLMVMVIPMLLAIVGILAAIAIPAYQGYANKAKAAQHSAIKLPAGVAAFADVSQSQKIILAENEAPTEVGSELKRVERVYSDTNSPEAASAEAVPAEPALAAEQSAEEVNREAQLEGEMEAYGQDESTASEEMTAEEMMQEEQQKQKDQMLEMMKTPAILAGMAFAGVLYLLFIFGFVGYLQARIGNLIWNNTTLDKLSFVSTLRARDFIWLYFSNIIAIMVTFGLATPWAQIRMARYRASKLQIIGDVDFDQFVGDKKAEVAATGEEIADFFDVDLSFG